MVAVGSDVSGIVKRVEPYGLFVEAHGQEIFVQITELSWIPVKSPQEQWQKGDRVTIRLISADKDGAHLCGSIKRLDVAGNPYREYGGSPSSIEYLGKVLNVHGDLASIKMESGALGFLYPRNPAALVVGQQVRVRIRSVDPDAGDLRLIEADGNDSECGG